MALFISFWEWNRERNIQEVWNGGHVFTTNWPLISSISLCHQLEFPTLRPFLGGAVTVTLFHHSAEPCHPWHAHKTGISVLACFNPAKLPALWRCFAWESQRILKKLGVKVDHETRGANVRWCFGSTNRVRFRMNSESYTTSAHNYPQDTARTCLHKVHFAHLIWVCLEIRDLGTPISSGSGWVLSQGGSLILRHTQWFQFYPVSTFQWKFSKAK